MELETSGKSSSASGGSGRRLSRRDRSRSSNQSSHSNREIDEAIRSPSPLKYDRNAASSEFVARVSSLQKTSSSEGNAAAMTSVVENNNDLIMLEKLSPPTTPVISTLESPAIPGEGSIKPLVSSSSSSPSTNTVFKLKGTDDKLISRADPPASRFTRLVKLWVGDESKATTTSNSEQDASSAPLSPEKTNRNSDLLSSPLTVPPHRRVKSRSNFLLGSGSGGNSPKSKSDNKTSITSSTTSSATNTQNLESATTAISRLFTRATRGASGSGGGSGSSSSAASSPKSSGKIEIGRPMNVTHRQHAAFDPKEKKIVGGLSHWGSSGGLVQFGCSIKNCPRVDVPGYKERIPAVLVLLKDELIRLQGLDIEGIFRITAPKAEQELYKAQIDKGVFKGSGDTKDDAVCMAALLKEWFRLMPVRLLNVIPRNVIGDADVASTARCAEIIPKMSEPGNSVYLWLLDLLVDTARKEAENKMSAKALAVVVAPNLYKCADDTDMKNYMFEMDGAIAFVERSIQWRSESLKGPKMVKLF